MDKDTYAKIAEAHGTHEDAAKATVAINKLFNAVVTDCGKIDVNDPLSAATLKHKLVGPADIDSTITPSGSTVKFDGEIAEGETFGLAFVGCLIKVINAKALGKFFGETGDKTKRRPDGLGSPQRSGGSPFAGRAY